MVFTFPTNKIPFTLILGVQTSSPQNIKIEAHNNPIQTPGTPKIPYTYYINRLCQVNGYYEFELRFPQTPNNLSVNVFNTATGNYEGNQDPTFIVPKFDAKKLETKPIWLTPADRSFIKFAQWFAQNATVLSSGDREPCYYHSDDAKFSIHYYHKLRDEQTGLFVNTPARIGHNTGIIDVSHLDFNNYTVAQRMIILLHEYSHKFKNPQNGKAVEDEIAADIAALNMYLSLGYPLLEALIVFLNVFRGANTELNNKRYLIIKDFGDKFEAGKLTKFYKVENPPIKQAA